MQIPVRIAARADEVLTNPAVVRLVDEVRGASDACVFLSGGAGRMAQADADAVRKALEALTIVQGRGVRLAVGDGGTQSGVMEAAGLVRAASALHFPLVGVAPAPEVPPRGPTPLDPHHSHVVLIDNRDWPADEGYWGSETAAMHQLFDALAAGRPSAAVVANGGGIVLREVAEHIRARRQVVLLEGTGRAADALAGLLRGGKPPPGDDPGLAPQLQTLDLGRHAGLFTIVPISAGAAGLADALLTCLRRSSSVIKHET